MDMGNKNRQGLGTCLIMHIHLPSSPTPLRHLKQTHETIYIKLANNLDLKSLIVKLYLLRRVMSNREKREREREYGKKLG